MYFFVNLALFIQASCFSCAIKMNIQSVLLSDCLSTLGWFFFVQKTCFFCWNLGRWFPCKVVSVVSQDVRKCLPLLGEVILILTDTIDGRNIQTSRKRLDWHPRPQMSMLNNVCVTCHAVGLDFFCPLVSTLGRRKQNWYFCSGGGGGRGGYSCPGFECFVHLLHVLVLSSIVVFLRVLCSSIILFSSFSRRSRACERIIADQCWHLCFLNGLNRGHEITTHFGRLKLDANGNFEAFPLQQCMKFRLVSLGAIFKIQ